MNTEQYIEHVDSADIEDIRANFTDWMQQALDIEDSEDSEQEGDD